MLLFSWKISFQFFQCGHLKWQPFWNTAILNFFETMIAHLQIMFNVAVEFHKDWFNHLREICRTKTCAKMIDFYAFFTTFFKMAAKRLQPIAIFFHEFVLLVMLYKPWKFKEILWCGFWDMTLSYFSIGGHFWMRPFSNFSKHENTSH